MTDKPSTKLALSGVIADLVRYCGQYAGPLVRISWVPCLLTAVGLIVLEFFIIGRAEQTPAWILSDDFYPPSWVAALIPAPFQAMVWMSVIGSMQRGEEPQPSGPLGLDLNRRIVLATIVFSIFNLLIGGSRNLERLFMVSGLPLIHGANPPQEALEMWVGALLLFHGIVAVVAFTVCYLVAGPVIRQGTLDIRGLWDLTRGNRARLLALFVILGAVRGALVMLIDPAVGWMTDNFTDTSASWTLAEASLRHGTYIPISMATFVVSAVVVEIVLRRLHGSPSAVARA